MDKGDMIGVAVAIIVIGAMVYLLLGSFGLLPQWFYSQCENIDKDTAQKRGCCEERGKYEPISLMFGSDNCDRYPNELS